jgi:DNA-binding NtrC family response regulator
LTDNPIKVCFLTPDPALAELIARTIGNGFVMRHSDEIRVDRLGELKDWCDVVLLDLRETRSEANFQSGLQLMDELSKTSDHPAVVVLCERDSPGVIHAVIQHGAYDSVTNPPNMIELRFALRRASKLRAAEKEIESLRERKRGATKLHEMHGTSPAMQELFATVQKIALCDVNVLITGETGTGKELLARAIHQSSSRASHPLMAFSCANLPDSLIEDELFGHEKGAFTGAVSLRRGRVEQADQGTLFLDEIGDINVSLQPKLLRVLQERRFERLGGCGTVNVNIRVICATNRNLAEMVQQGTFREDLFYRLNVVQIHIPPLRDRRDDIALLAQLFLVSYAQQFNVAAKRFSHSALRALEEHSWPGNVRELENAVQRAVVMSEGKSVDVCHLPPAIRSAPEEPLISGGGSYEDEIRQFKRRLVLRTLEKCGWRKAESARTLGIAREYLHRLINQLEIRHDELPIQEPTHVESPIAPRQLM